MSTCSALEKREGAVEDSYADFLDEVLYTEEQIKEKIKELAEAISRDYAGKRIVLIGVLKGASLFITDLCKRISGVDVRLDFMAVSSYGDSTTSSGVVKILMDTRSPLRGENIIIVEDIVDSGLTLEYLTRVLKDKDPESLCCAVFLRKPECLKVDGLPLKYIGFDIPNKWVVGYGMDYAEKYRCLPLIGVLSEKIYKK